MHNESTALIADGGACDNDSGGFHWSWKLFGPGLLVCLADTDAGCLITAGQSGARWGYSLLPLQLVLIPILFATQELTIRLAVFTKQGHTACIREHFGPAWAWVVCAVLLLQCTLAMVSQLSGVFAVAMLWGIGPTLAIVVAAGLITFIVLFFKYKQLEAIGICMGLFELTFVVSMFMLAPPMDKVLKGMTTLHDSHNFVLLIGANIGAVIMPWMLCFQQNAVVAQGTQSGKGIAQERAQTALGSFLTQLIMIGTLVTMAATQKHPEDLNNAADFVDGLSPLLGEMTAKIFVSLAFLGGSLCAAFIVTITPAWSLCEAMGRDGSKSLDCTPSEEPIFYGCFLAIILVGTAINLFAYDVVKLNIMITLLNALSLPLVLAFLYILAASALPQGVRITGAHKVLLGITFAIVSLTAVSSGIYGLTEPYWR